MKHQVALTMTSLLSILFTTFHLTDDIVHGMSPGGLQNLPVVLVLAVWRCDATRHSSESELDTARSRRFTDRFP